MAREFAKSFYESEAWRQCRKSYAKSVGMLCERCLERGLYNPGKVVHHIVHLTPENITNPSISMGWNNLKLLCQECHAKEHAKDKTDRYCFDDNGNLLKK